MRRGNTRVQIKKLHKSKTLSMNDDPLFKNMEINQLIRDYMIREAFHMFDTNDSGDIDSKEFSKLIMTLGIEMTEKKINELLKEIDTDGSETIDLEEFTKMMRNYQFSKDSPMDQHLENTFNEYDKDMDSYICADDFRKVSEELDSIAMSPEDCDFFISLCKHFAKEKGIVSTSPENGINKEEFINALKCLNFIYETKPEERGIQKSNSNTNNFGASQTGLVDTQNNISERQSNVNLSSAKVQQLSKSGSSRTSQDKSRE